MGGFKAILDDPRLDADAKREAGRLILCTGKVYYDIVGHEASEEAEGVAVARLEQLYPFPVAAYDELLSRYPSLTEVVWTQEEPQNMGAWRAIRHRLEEGLPAEVDLRYVGRPWRASPSEGYPTAHLARAGPHRARGAGRVLGLRSEGREEAPGARGCGDVLFRLGELERPLGRLLRLLRPAGAQQHLRKDAVGIGAIHDEVRWVRELHGLPCLGQAALGIALASSEHATGGMALDQPLQVARSGDSVDFLDGRCCVVMAFLGENRVGVVDESR